MTTTTATTVKTTDHREVYPGPDGSRLYCTVKITTEPVPEDDREWMRPSERNAAQRVTVWYEWTADPEVRLDRESGHGISTGYDRKGMALAERFLAAFNAGQIRHTGVEVRTDVHGATYIAASSPVMGKYLNSDLRKMGF